MNAMNASNETDKWARVALREVLLRIKLSLIDKCEGMARELAEWEL